MIILSRSKEYSLSEIKPSAEYNFTDKTEERSNPFRKSDVRIACTFLNSGVILFIIESGGIFSPNGCV